MNEQMKQGINSIVLTEDQKGSLMRLTNKLFDMYDVDKSDALDITECKKVFKDVFTKMGCPEILSESKLV